ncbi:MAG: PSD1 and planctomycete cytochrome C domain-containing protein [Planctomycetota bacterium]
MPIRQPLPGIVLVAASFTWIASAHGAADSHGTPEQLEFFEKSIRPVLVERCHSCHGPKKQMSGLRLDSREAILRGGENGSVVLPGDPENSPLLEALRYDGGIQMPPENKLEDPVIASVARWIEMGAPWSKDPARTDTNENWKSHWAFQPISNPRPPKVKEPQWPSTSIDQFILHGLEAKGLSPSPDADKRTLLRRVTFDLIGLPPSPQEMESFVNDDSPDAWARVIDRLLASPHYGERWARHWMDVARYADTKGYVFFEQPNFPWAYTYRDYLIRSFNEDKPYDQFVIEQLAADQLPLETDSRSLAAMGFLTIGGHFMNIREDIIDDRIDVVTRGLLGLTVSCARCHDHKFDPVPTKDYYSLFGVFANSVEPIVPPLIHRPPATKEYEEFARELAEREKKLADFVRDKYNAVVGGSRTRVAEYLLAAHAARGQPKIDNFMLIADGGDINPYMLKRWQSFLERTRRSGDSIFAPWHALAELPDGNFPAEAPGKISELLAQTGTKPAVHPLVAKAIKETPPQSMADVASTYAKLLASVDEHWRALQSSQPSSVTLADPGEEQLRQVLYGPESPTQVPMNPMGDLDLLPDRPAQEELKKLLGSVEEFRSKGPHAPPRAMVLVDTVPAVTPFVYLRGNPHNLGDPVPRQFLEVLAGADRKPFQKGSGRLELAQAIANPRNPLTARVLVNRVWMHHFGQGLVRTPSDFGLRSDPPSHPELLDHLANEFIDSGWSIKTLHRRILLSKTYQQSSQDRLDARNVDPENLLLWRMNRRRLDFESTRDAILAVSGSLDRTIGGPSHSLFTEPFTTRRSVYGHIDRMNLPGLLRTFDVPSPDATSPKRDVTTVAPQALYFMNNRFSEVMSRRLVEQSSFTVERDLARRVDWLYRQLFGREPSPEEIADADEYIGKFRAATVPWQRYAQALLWTNEFVFVD